MKNRLRQFGDGSKATTVNSGKAHYKRNMKNKQRLGGDALSLQVFANAKSNNAYNPHLIKKQRERYRNAKIVKKFKKGLNQENDMETTSPSSSMPEGMDAAKEGNRRKNTGRKKKATSLQSAREEYEKRRDEMEKAKREREAMIRAKEEEKARAACRRKALRQSMFKKTRFGQPVMKYRIEHILEGIKEEQLS